MTFQERVPRQFGAIRREFDAALCEDVPNGRAENRTEAQLAKLAEDPRVDDVRFSSDLGDECSQLRRFLRPAEAPSRICRPTAPEPPSERVAPNDQGDVSERRSEWAAEPDRPAALSLGQVDAPRQSAVEGVVLFYEALDLPGQFGITRSGERDGEQVVEGCEETPVRRSGSAILAASPAEASPGNLTKLTA